MTSSFAQELRFAARMLRKSPVATVVAIVSLALGIGANTAIFSVMNTLLFRPLPIYDATRLVHLSTSSPDYPQREGALSLAMYQRLRDDQRVFSNLFAWTGGGITNIDANGTKYVATISTVTGEYFSTLGVQPLFGRLIGPQDLKLDSGLPARVAVIDYRCWERRYQRDPKVLGKIIHVQDQPLTIIGVTRAGFTGLIVDVASEVTVPIGFAGKTSYRNRKQLGLEVYARLKPGMTIEQARAHMEAIWPSVLETSIPEVTTSAERRAFLSRRVSLESAATGKSYLRSEYSRPLFVLMTCVGLLLLIACANIANLTLARAAGRHQEFSIRLALGASGWRIAFQLLAENLILSFAGGIIGIGMAFWASTKVLDMMWSGLVPHAFNSDLDIRVLVFTCLATFLAAILAGLLPAWRVVRANRADLALHHNARSIHGGDGLMFAKVLIAAQAALAIVLVVCAVIFVRSLQNLRSADVGYHRHGLVILQLFPQSGSESQHMPGRTSYYRELAEQLRSVPGVDAVSYSHMGPVLGYEYTEPASVALSQIAPVPAVFEAVGPGFFALAGMHVLVGRDFAWRDTESSQPVAIISESLARRLFPNTTAVGRAIDSGDHKNLTVVGVVNSASLWTPQSREPMAVYLSLMQMPTFNSSYIDLRVRGDVGSVLPAARRVVQSMGRQFILKAQTLDERSDGFLATERLIAALSSFFGGLALLLASIGLYGLISYTVLRRTPELGLRMALGAESSSVRFLVVKEVFALWLAGMAVGIPAALAGTRWISSMVYGVAGSAYWTTFAIATLILLASALVAAYVPARRASRLDPMTALRGE